MKDAFRSAEASSERLDISGSPSMHRSSRASQPEGGKAYQHAADDSSYTSNVAGSYTRSSPSRDWLPSLFPQNSVFTNGDDWRWALVPSLIAALYGSCHLIGWNAAFPTFPECIIWRVCGLSMSVFGFYIFKLHSLIFCQDSGLMALLQSADSFYTTNPFITNLKQSKSLGKKN